MQGEGGQRMHAALDGCWRGRCYLPIICPSYLMPPFLTSLVTALFRRIAHPKREMLPAYVPPTLSCSIPLPNLSRSIPLPNLRGV